MREYNEVDSFYDFTEGLEPQRMALATEDDGDEIIFFHVTINERKITVSEVSGAYENAGAFWCLGHLTGEEIIADYHETQEEHE